MQELFMHQRRRLPWVAEVLLLLFKSSSISSENANKVSQESEQKTLICCNYRKQTLMVPRKHDKNQFRITDLDFLYRFIFTPRFVHWI